MMAPFVIVGLILQALALTRMFRRLGRRWLVHAGAVFIVLATVYHGLMRSSSGSFLSEIRIAVAG
jgi:hypothetical protein